MQPPRSKVSMSLPKMVTVESIHTSVGVTVTTPRSIGMDNVRIKEENPSTKASSSGTKGQVLYNRMPPQD